MIPPPPPNSPSAGLIPPPPPGSDIKDLERLWLTTAVAYEVFDVSLMEDHDWDLFAKELNDRRQEWSPYFHWVIPGGRAGEFNVGTTASGIDWAVGLGKVYRDHAEKLYGDPDAA